MKLDILKGEKMEILELIKKRKSIRKYQNKLINKKIIKRIIDAGVWGPSVPSFLGIQPWELVVIKNKSIIKNISEIIIKKSKYSKTGVNILVRSSANVIRNAPLLILIYNSGELKSMKLKYKEVYSNFKTIIEVAELSAIAATIQNMILVAESMGVGTCWLDTPIFCKDEIKSYLGINNELMAILTVGYPDEQGRRSPRKPILEMVKYL